MSAEPAVQADGRLARSERARAAIVDALLDLIEQGDLRPTAPRIAERAGVSLRTVFQHFRDLDAVFSLAAERHFARLRPLLQPIDPRLPLAERLPRFVRQRARVLETLTPVRRAALLMEPFSKQIASSLRAVRTAGAREVAGVFAPELERLAPTRRAELQAALVAASSWSTWNALRQHQGSSRARARRVLALMLGALLREAR